MMLFFIAGMGILVLSGLVALMARRSFQAATAAGVGGAVVGSGLALVPAVHSVVFGVTHSLTFPWGSPFGTFRIEVDPLSGFFLLPILFLSALAAIYGGEYLKAWRDKKPLGDSWFCFNILIASMAMVAVARNAVLFLLAWEMMSLSSFFLVMFDADKPKVSEAGWTYLVATHLGTAFILAMFVILALGAETLDFDGLKAGAALAPATASLMFLFAVIGFGAKAGFMPFHVWLPEAHPAAPSHVSAVMSGVMIKTGIYGLIRAMSFLGQPLEWWGWVLVAIGVLSGVLGVLFALAQKDLKRMLAYSSVENIGIIALGLGIGVIGLARGFDVLTVLGFGGALLHVLNHAMFKGLLFLAAGAVGHGAGMLDMDRLGGLMKRMKWTGAGFLIAAVAICGLPPLNGFVSEFMIFLGAFSGGTTFVRAAAVPCMGVLVGLALIGGLAAACFTRAFGIVFLGEPRSENAAHSHEAGWAMRLPMVILMFACVAIGMLAPILVMRLTPVLQSLGTLGGVNITENLSKGAAALSWAVAVSAGFLLALAVLIALRMRLLSNRKVEQAMTWDCGYARPTPKMQYTASSFGQPLTNLFRTLLGTRKRVTAPTGILPPAAAFASDTPDRFMDRLFRPVFQGVSWALAHLRMIQQGRVQLYVLYIAVTLVLLLILCLR